MANEAERHRVLALIRAHGWNATSFQILEQGFRYWFAGERGCVAYVDTGRAWVAAGAPIAAEHDLADLASDFVRHAAAHARRAAFFATEQRFVQKSELLHLLIGEQPVWDPREWSRASQQMRSLREQLRRARVKGVRVTPLSATEIEGDPALRQAIEQLIGRWATAKPLPQMGFLVQVAPFDFAAERKLFVARRDGEIVGFAAAVPVYARGGWFLEDLIRAPGAPNGTVESLVDAVMHDAARAGSTYVTLGLAPLSGGVTQLLHLARRAGSALYDFDGLRHFKAKFRPAHWVPVYLSRPRGQHALVAVHDSLVAFARRGLLGYGIRSFLRGPSAALWLLGILLVPWTLLLAAAGDEWFPSATVRWAWVSFDAIMCAGFIALSRREHAWLSSALLAGASADVLLTTWQLFAFNVERVQSLVQALILAVAALAPVLALIVLINHRRRSSRASRWAPATRSAEPP